MKKTKIAVCLLIAVLLLISTVSLTFASGIDTAKKVSLNVTYKHGEVAFSGLEIEIFRFAELHADGTYSLCGDFASYPVNIYGVTSQAEWRDITETLSAYASADKIPSTYKEVTDDDGKVYFKDVPAGMYLVSSAKAETDSAFYTFEAFISVLPRPSDDGTYSYEVEAIPKFDLSEREKDELEMKVVKMWRDDGNSEPRPDFVTVEILRNGTKYTEIKLSPDNNWSYRWTVPNDNAKWEAVERGVAENYSVSVTREKTTIVITNTYEGELPPPPPTGDTTSLTLYVTVFGVSGALLMILALALLKDKTKEEGRA